MHIPKEVCNLKCYIIRSVNMSSWVEKHSKTVSNLKLELQSSVFVEVVYLLGWKDLSSMAIISPLPQGRQIKVRFPTQVME